MNKFTPTIYSMDNLSLFHLINQKQLQLQKKKCNKLLKKQNDKIHAKSYTFSKFEDKYYKKSSQ